MFSKDSCFCCSIKSGVLVISTIEIGSWLTCFFTGISGIFGNSMSLTNGTETLENFFLPFDESEITDSDFIVITINIIWSLVVLFAIFQVFLGSILLYGVLKDKLDLVKHWFHIKLVILFGSIIFYAFSLAEDPQNLTIVRNFLLLLVDMYMLRVVHLYIRQLKDRSNLNIHLKRNSSI